MATIVKVGLDQWIIASSKILTYRSSGCRLEHSFYGCEVYEFETDSKELYRTGYRTASDASAFIDNWGKLSGKAADAS